MESSSEHSSGADESSPGDGGGGRPAISGLASILGLASVTAAMTSGAAKKRKREQAGGAAPPRKRKDVEDEGAGAGGVGGAIAAAVGMEDAPGGGPPEGGGAGGGGAGCGGAAGARRAAAPPVMDPTAVFVNGIPFKCTDERALAALFYKCGRVAEARICLDAERRGRGFGFVRFESVAGAAAASSRAATTPFSLAGKELALGPCRADLVARFAGKPSAGDGLAHECVFVKHIPLRMTDSSELGRAFADAGAILESRVALGADGKSKGFGFVRFASAECAEAALARVVVIAGRSVVVEPCKQDIVDKFHEMPGATAPAFATVTSFKPRGLRKGTT
jgi:hypothetical protein